MRTARGPNHRLGAASSAPPATARRRTPTSSCTVGEGASATTPTAYSENWWKRTAQMQQQDCLWPRCQTGFDHPPPPPLAPPPPPQTRLYVQWKLKNISLEIEKRMCGSLWTVITWETHSHASKIILSATKPQYYSYRYYIVLVYLRPKLYCICVCAHAPSSLLMSANN